MDSASSMMAVTAAQVTPVTTSLVAAGAPEASQVPGEQFSALLGNVLEAAPQQTVPNDVAVLMQALQGTLQVVLPEQAEADQAPQEQVQQDAAGVSEQAVALAGFMQAALLVPQTVPVVPQMVADTATEQQTTPVAVTTAVSGDASCQAKYVFSTDTPMRSVLTEEGRFEQSSEVVQQQQAARTQQHGEAGQLVPAVQPALTALTEHAAALSSQIGRQQQELFSLPQQQTQNGAAAQATEPLQSAAEQVSPQAVQQMKSAAELLPGTKVTVQSPAQPVFAQSAEVAVAAAQQPQAGMAGAEGDQQGNDKDARHTADGRLVTALQGEQLLQEQGQMDAGAQKLMEPGHQPVQVARQHPAVDALHRVADNLPVQAEQVVRQVAERLSTQPLKQGNDQISLKLAPEHLGNLQLNLRMEDQRLRIEVVAEQRGVRDALLTQVEELRETLARQNITMDSFDVTTGGNNAWNQQTPDWRQAASDRRPYQEQRYGAPAHTMMANAGDGGAGVRYFAPQYQSTLDVRF